MSNTKRPHQIDEAVGSRIRARRAMLGMSQEKLAGAVGVTFQQIQKYESGANRVSASRLQAIADALDVRPSYFFDGAAEALGGQTKRTNSDDRSRDLVEFLSSAEGVELNLAYAKIKKASVRSRVVKLVMAIGHRERADGSRASYGRLPRP